jgi:hypothetical protein
LGVLGFRVGAEDQHRQSRFVCLDLTQHLDATASRQANIKKDKVPVGFVNGSQSLARIRCLADFLGRTGILQNLPDPATYDGMVIDKQYPHGSHF